MPATRRPPAVAKVLERAAASIRDHELMLPGQTVVLAVSGGPDSVCLLETMVRLRRQLKVGLVVAHVDHHARPGSGADASYVRRLATRHALPFELRSVSAAASGGSKEARMRMLRRQELIGVMRDAGAERIATAHTRDDDAETVLLRLLVGSGLTGASGIRHRVGPFVRPLLDVGRDEVEAFCGALRLRPRRDPTNDDPAFALRNALRLKGIPALERALHRNVRGPLARSAALLAADDAELTRQALAAVPDVMDERPDGIALDADGLLGLPSVLAARVVAQAAFRLGKTTTRADIDAVLDLARGRAGRRRSLTGGIVARRERSTVHLS
jgi:tRNA(Ile)-lysidine synthase